MALFKLYADFKGMNKTITFLQGEGLLHKERQWRNGHIAKVYKGMVIDRDVTKQAAVRILGLEKVPNFL